MIILFSKVIILTNKLNILFLLFLSFMQKLYLAEDYKKKMERISICYLDMIISYQILKFYFILNEISVNRSVL